MGIDELKELRNSFLELKQKTEEAYIEYTSFDVDRNSLNFLTNFREKYNIIMFIYIVTSIINIIVSSTGIISTGWITYMLSVLFAGSSIMSVVICRLKVSKLSESDYRIKKDLCDKYLNNLEICRGLAQKIISVLNEFDDEFKANNQELINFYMMETLEYSDSNSKDIKSYIDSAILKFICDLRTNSYDDEEVISSVNEILLEQLSALGESDNIELGNTRILN